MTREELRDYVDEQRGLGNIPYHIYSTLIDGIDTLEQQPCEDCISRQAVLSMQYRIDDSATLSTRDVVNVNDIEDLPLVTPQSKIGHWIDRFPAKECKCSVCDFLICISNGSYIDMVGQMKYCPNCGAKMVGSQESEGKE